MGQIVKQTNMARVGDMLGNRTSMHLTSSAFCPIKCMLFIFEPYYVAILLTKSSHCMDHRRTNFSFTNRASKLRICAVMLTHQKYFAGQCRLRCTYVESYHINMMSRGSIGKRLHAGTVSRAFEFTSLRSELPSVKQGVGID